MPPSGVYPDTKAMVIVVDVFDSLAQETTSPPAKAPVLERFEIDVDVIPHSTTADMVLADVAGALQEMQLVMCVPQQTAALASGRVLPPLAVIQHAMGVADSSDSDRRPVSTILSLEDKYVAAVQRALDTVDTHQMPVAAPPRILSLALHIGNDYVVEDKTGRLSPSTTTWSVVPRLIEAASSPTSKAAVQAAPPVTSFLRVLTRNPASVGVTAEAGDAPQAPLAALPSLSRDGAQTMTTASSRGSSGDLLLDAESTTACFVVNRATAEVIESEHSPTPPSAVCSTAPSPSPSLLCTQEQPPAPVVALEDVGVAAFRRLQARQAQLLARSAQRHDDSLNAGGLAAAPVEEHRCLQPALLWAADVTAEQAEVERLHAEHELTGERGKVEAPGATKVDASESLQEVAGGGSQSRTGRCRWGVGVSLARSSQPQLRVQWLAAVGENIRAYRKETAALCRAAEKVRQWRELMKEQLREEIAQLEAEEAQCSAALAERDVLRRRVVQLEAQVAAAKAAEIALLATQESATALSPASAKEQRARGDFRAAISSAELHPQCVTAAVAKPALEPFSDTSASKHRDLSKRSPPLPPEPVSSLPPQARRSAPTTSGGCAYGSSGVHRWSGRRVPLTTQRDTVAAPPKRTALALPAAQQRPSRSRSQLAIGRSFLSPSLQAEVWAALASDDDADSCMTASHSNSGGRAEATRDGGRSFDATAGKGLKEALLPPAVSM